MSSDGRKGLVPSSYLMQYKPSKRRSKHKQPPIFTAASQQNKQPIKEERQRRESGDSDSDGLPFGEIELNDLDIFGYPEEDDFAPLTGSMSSIASEASTIVETFIRKPVGKYLVLHSYHGEDENDVTILKGNNNQRHHNPPTPDQYLQSPSSFSVDVSPLMDVGLLRLAPCSFILHFPHPYCASIALG